MHGCLLLVVVGNVGVGSGGQLHCWCQVQVKNVKTTSGPKILAANQLEGRDFLGQCTPLRFPENMNFVRTSEFWNLT